MDSAFISTVSVGNVITLMGVLIAFLSLRSEHRRERRSEREAQDRRHIQNLEALQSIRVEIATMKHLDVCMDEVKEELKELRRELNEKEDKHR